VIEKERKDLEREEAKRAKAEQRQLGLQRKEEQRGDDAMRGVDKQQGKKNDKAKQLLRKDVNAEVKKSRGEANLLVLQFFDEEEEGVEVVELSSSNESRVASDGLDSSIGRDIISVQQYLRETAVRKEELLPVPVPVGSRDADPPRGVVVKHSSFAVPSWDDVLQVTSTLHVFRRHLHLEDPIELNSFIKSLQVVSLTASTSTSKASDVDRMDSSSGIKDCLSHLEVGGSEEHTLEDTLVTGKSRHLNMYQTADDDVMMMY